LLFDLGLRENYEELYQWLDAARSQECGDNVNTYLVKNPRQIGAMKRDWALLRKTGRVDYLNDEAHRQRAFEEVFAETQRPRTSYRALSLADRVIRALIGDPQLKIAALLTNDEPAFHDVCHKRGVELVSILRQI
jgi:hypothetical protein